VGRRLVEVVQVNTEGVSEYASGNLLERVRPTDRPLQRRKFIDTASNCAYFS